MDMLTKGSLLLLFAALLVAGGCADDSGGGGGTTADTTSGADTSGADTSGTSGADTSGGDDTSGTSGADTSGADTSGADTSGADTSGADTSGADTSGGDTSGGVELCGNGRVDDGEACDGLALNNRRCTDRGYRGGALACKSDCTFDESGCTNDNPNTGCGVGEFTCTNGSCIPTNQLCNGSADCLRGEDELSCGGRECQAGEFTCPDSSCIPTAAVCNGALDCPSGADEQNCGTGEVPAGWTCTALWYNDGDCDCGCGVVDIDCAAPTVDQCEYCFVCGTCANVNPANNSQCQGGISAVPAGWTCSAFYYDADDGCDCACGAPDPDCDDASALVYGCAPGQTCSAAGECEGNSTVPAAWTCFVSFYGTGDGCDCGCGAPDPDCADPSATVYGCASGQTCSAAGQCVGGSVGTVPAEWTCSASFYGTHDGCDCGCGVVDPDCDDATAASCEYCGSCGVCANVNETNNAACEVPVSTAPPEWTCIESFYNDGLYCDCACGAPDPDCALSFALVFGCGIGQTCNAAGECEGGAPSGWTCTPSFYGTDDGCDCGCGVVDPDCDDATAASCEYCGSCGVCANVNTTNNAVCL
jgi:hypothetical protein